MQGIISIFFTYLSLIIITIVVVTNILYKIIITNIRIDIKNEKLPDFNKKLKNIENNQEKILKLLEKKDMN